MLPMVILTIAFAATGIYPFGSNQITIIDMYHQYVPFLSELQYKLQHGGSLLYSWHGAGGFNFWTLMAYYGASPLNLLLGLFPAGLVVEGVTFILMLKVGFSSMFQYLYLKRTYPRTAAMPLSSRTADNLGAVAFGTMYALSAYFLGYFWCIMWIDVMALLPLCMLGLRRLVEDGRPVIYCVSLALIIFCNYYIAIMMCIFIIIYYLVIYFEKPRDGGFKDFVAKTAYVALSSVIGAAMSCAMFLPTWRNMKNAYYFKDDIPEDWSFYHDPLAVINQLLPNAHICVREGLPNIYCGLFVVIMLVLFFVSRTITFRVKLVNGLFLAVMFFSLNVNIFDFFWHGMHFPNELPFRYSFAISFVLCSLGYQAYLRLGQVRRKTLMATLAGLLGYYLIAANLLEDSLDNKEEFLYIGLGLLFLYGMILLINNHRMLPGKTVAALFVMVVAVEMLCSTIVAFDRAGNVERSDYLSDRAEIEQMVSQTRDEMVRVERFDETLMNMPALYHYNGVSQFASSLNANATELMEKVGLDGEPGSNRYNYVLTSPVINSMLNIKYMLLGSEGSLDNRFTLRDQNELYSLMENSQPLSIGYLLPDSIRTWETIDMDPFNVQDDYVRAATDGLVDGVYERVENPVVDGGEMMVEEVGGGNFESSGGSGIAGNVSLNYTVDKAGDYYVFVEADSAETIDIYREDGTSISVRDDVGSVAYVGDLAEGESFDVQIVYEEDGEGGITCHACRLNDEAWNRAYGLISRDLMEVVDFGDTFIEGKIDASRNGVFTTSVFYEKGWSLYVDGKKQEIEELVGGDFISVPLTRGEHTIKLRYIPDGFIPGVLLMICGILALIGLVRIRGGFRLPSISGSVRRRPLGLPEGGPDYSKEE